MMAKKREFGYWISARELRESTRTEETEEDGRKRTYVVTPLGTRARRIVFCGNISQKNSEDTMTKATITDGTSNFYVTTFSNDYGIEAKENLDSLEVGSDVFVMGRVNTYLNNDKLYININPEVISPTDRETRKFWNARMSYITRRKILAAIQARKNPDAEDLLAKGYTRSEAESSIRSVNLYPEFDLSALQGALSIEPEKIQDTKDLERREFILNYVKNNDTDGMGCRYDDLVAASANIGLGQGDLDELLNSLGSEGEIFEVSLKRYKVI